MSTRESESTFTGDYGKDLHNALHDHLSAAWNGWEAACKFESDEQQVYYMTYIRLLSEFLLKIQKVKP